MIQIWVAVIMLALNIIIFEYQQIKINNANQRSINALIRTNNAQNRIIAQLGKYENG